MVTVVKLDIITQKRLKIYIFSLKMTCTIHITGTLIFTCFKEKDGQVEINFWQ